MKNENKLDLNPGSGDITFVLDGEEVTLKPTLRACIGISRMDDSPMATVDKIVRLNFDTITQVLAFGLGIGPGQKLQEQIYRTGVINLTRHAINFVNVVNNGGRPVSEKDLYDLKDDEGNQTAPIQE